MKILIVCLLVFLSVIVLAKEDLVLLKIDTKPLGAQIRINGKLVGCTPFAKKIQKGLVNIEIEREYYEKIKKEIDLKEEKIINCKLVPIIYTVNLKSQKTRIIFINNKKNIIKANKDYIVKTTVENRKHIELDFTKFSYYNEKLALKNYTLKINPNNTKLGTIIINNSNGYNSKIIFCPQYIGYCINEMKLKKNITKIDLFDGYYWIEGSKKHYKHYKKLITFDKKLKNIKNFEIITDVNDFNLVFNVITEYCFYNNSKHDLKLGASINFINTYGLDGIMDGHALVLGFTTMFSGELYTITGSLLNMKFFYLGNVFYWQPGLLGIFDSIEFSYNSNSKDKKWYINNIISFKLGLNISLRSITHLFRTNVYLKAGLIDKFSGKVYMGIGLVIDYLVGEDE